MDQLLNYIEKMGSPKKLVRYMILLFKAFVVLASLYGGVKGFESAVKTTRGRQNIRLTNKTLEPIVNILVKVGTFISYPVFSAILSALVVATAPISVPYIILISKEDEARRGDDA